MPAAGTAFAPSLRVIAGSVPFEPALEKDAESLPMRGENGAIATLPCPSWGGKLPRFVAA
jgi:hypothetical protein